jgi:hypothetical protein
MRRWILALVLGLILTIPLALLLRDFVRDVFLVELGRVIWAARLIFESLPQVFVWAVLVVILLVLAVRTLRSRIRPLPDGAHGPTDPQGRVQALSRWIERSAQSEYFKQSLAHHLTGLAWEVMAHREHTSPDRLKQRQRAGGLDLPPVVGETLRTGQTPYVPTPEGLFSRIWRRLTLGKLGATWGAAEFSPGRGLDPALELLVEFLETQVEIRPLSRAQPTGVVERRSHGEAQRVEEAGQDPTQG